MPTLPSWLRLWWVQESTRASPQSATLAIPSLDSRMFLLEMSMWVVPKLQWWRCGPVQKGGRVGATASHHCSWFSRSSQAKRSGTPPVQVMDALRDIECHLLPLAAGSSSVSSVADLSPQACTSLAHPQIRERGTRHHICPLQQTAPLKPHASHSSCVPSKDALLAVLVHHAEPFPQAAALHQLLQSR